MAEPERRTSLLESYENAAVIVSGVPAAQAALRTPCPGYDVAGLIDHLVEAAYRAAALGRGQTPPAGDHSAHVDLAEAPARWPGRTIRDCRRRSPCPGVRSTRAPRW